MKILLIGKDGQIGWELQRTLSPLGPLVAVGRAELDLTQPAALRTVVRACEPGVIVNAGAYTAVDRAESDEALAMAVNGEAPAVLAEEAKRLDALLIHYSTDYVFDGAASLPYAEDHPVGPLNIYGTTKLHGERAVQAAGARALLLRTGWVYGMRGKNFLLTMLALIRQRQTVEVVDDQHGAPTWCRAVAEATALVVAKLATPSVGERVFEQDASPVYHLTCSGATTWFGFASAIAEHLRAMEPDARLAQVRPIPTASYPTPAHRPGYSVLSNAKIARDFGIELPNWRDVLKLCLAA